MSDTVAATREPTSRPAENSGSAPTASPQETKHDPMRDLLEKFDKVATLIGSQNPGLAAGLKKVVSDAAMSGTAEQPMFRTQVAYMLQDVEKLTGTKSLGVPAELRSELAKLAATSPGLENERMKALVQSTPDVADRGAIRDVRRTASKIAGMGEDQYSKAAQDIIEVLENRMRLATRYQPQAEAQPTPTPSATRPKQQTNGEPAQRNVTAGESNTTPASYPGQSRVAASPGDGAENTAKPETDARPMTETRPKNVITNLMKGVRDKAEQSRFGQSAERNPWEPAPMAMGPRITAFEERLAAGKTDQHVRATEASGEKLMQAIERFSAGPGAAVLSRIEAAANAEQGGMQTVMSEMQPGGRYATLRSEFDTALEKNHVFAASFNAIEKAALNYGEERMALNANYQARGIAPTKLDERFVEAEAAIGRAAGKIPGRIPGQDIMAEMAEKVSQVLSRAVEKVRTMFVKSPENGPRQSSGPKP